MVENIRLKVIDSQVELLNIIDRNIGTLINFDWNAGYPLSAEKFFDTDSYTHKIVDNFKLLENNWVPVLVSKGYMSKYIWMYPHDHAKDEIKKFKSKNGDCEVYNIKYQNKAKLPYKYITIDGKFFGTKIPFNWSPKNRIELFNDILDSLTARSLALIISKSINFINYDGDDFLNDMLDEIYKRAVVEEL